MRVPHLVVLRNVIGSIAVDRLLAAAATDRESGASSLDLRLHNGNTPDAAAEIR